LNPRICPISPCFDLCSIPGASCKALKLDRQSLLFVGSVCLSSSASFSMADAVRFRSSSRQSRCSMPKVRFFPLGKAERLLFHGHSPSPSSSCCSIRHYLCVFFFREADSLFLLSLSSLSVISRLTGGFFVVRLPLGFDLLAGVSILFQFRPWKRPPFLFNKTPRLGLAQYCALFFFHRAFVGLA